MTYTRQLIQLICFFASFSTLLHAQSHDAALRYEQLTSVIASTSDIGDKAEALLELAEMYDEIGDVREALKLVRQASALGSESAKLKEPYYVNILGLDNKGQKEATGTQRSPWGLGVIFSGGRDSNVILEEVDTTFPSRKADSFSSLGLSMRHLWKFRQLPLISSLSLYSQRYDRLKDYNMTTSTLDQRLMTSAFNQSAKAFHRIGLAHYGNPSGDLLWNAEYASRLIWHSLGKLCRPGFGWKLRRNQYSPTAYKKLNSNHYELNLFWKRLFFGKSIQEWVFGYDSMLEDTRDDASRYLESHVYLRMKFQAFKHIFWHPSTSYSTRSYSSSNPREDRQFTAGFQVTAEVAPNSLVMLQMTKVNNDSNDSLSKYRKWTWRLSLNVQI